MNAYSRTRLARLVWFAVVPVLAGLHGCGTRTDGEVTVADSAGIRIVTSRAGTHPPPLAFHLGATPVADLAEANPNGPELQGLRAGVITPDGGAVLLLADGTLHGFGSDGRARWQRSPGGLGVTPGPSDSVTVLLASGRHLRVVGPSGGGREVALAWSGPEPLGEVFPHGGGFVALTAWSTALVPPDARPGLRADSARLVHFGPDGRLRDTLATVIGSQVGLVSIAGRVAVVPPHYPRLTLAAARADRLVVGTGTEDAVMLRGADGDVRSIARIEGRDLTLTEAERASASRFRERLVSGNPLTRSLAADFDRQLPMPPTRPPYARLLVDDEGRVWAADYPLPGQPPEAWIVFGPDLALVGRVTLPSGNELLDAGYGRVLVQARSGRPAMVGLYDLLPP